VAFVGTGASAIQFVPMIQRQVPQLAVFQRTAPWVLPKMDARISRGWQTLFEKLPRTQSLFRKLLYLQFELLNLSLKSPRLIKRLEAAGLKNIARGVKDADLRARLTPDFALGCKRILMSNTWYRALAQPNVRVLPGVARVEGHEVVAEDGQRATADHHDAGLPQFVSDLWPQSARLLLVVRDDRGATQVHSVGHHHRPA